MCPVLSKEQENLETQWAPRTHNLTQRQIDPQCQCANWLRKSDKDWVYNVTNFAWEHEVVNIYETIMVDVFHQLLKETVMHLIGWVRLLLKTNMPNTYCKLKNGSKATYSQLSGMEKLDKRFRQVPDFTGIKRFTNFSAVKQWTGVEQKAIVQQIMPVLAPLFKDCKQSDVLDFCRALVDFILIAQYCSHNDTTLGYLDQALMRINVYKKTFQSCRTSKRNPQRQFDFPKFHVMLHYSDHVWKFGTTDGYNTAHYKANHKFMLKVF